jgi:hypothetical protein
MLSADDGTVVALRARRSHRLVRRHRRMPQRSVEERVGILEQKVQDLDSLPARVTALEVQILQLRDEMRGGFSAMGEQMAGLREDLLAQIRLGDDGVRADLRGEMRQMREELRGEMHDMRDGLRAEMHEIRDELRVEIRQGDEETRRYMRVLHEDVVARIAALGESRRPRKPR